VHPKKNPIRFQDGCVFVPEGPGLGMDLSEDDFLPLMKSKDAAP